MKNILIGINGLMGSGKDTVALRLLQGFDALGFNPKRAAFAALLKRDVSLVLGVPEDKTIPGVRKLYQGYGQAMRHLKGVNYWVNRLDEQIRYLYSANKIVIITDVRFQEEADYIKNSKGLLIRVNCPDEIRRERLVARGDSDVESFKDVSERLLEPYQHTVNNGGTLEELKEEIKNLIRFTCDHYKSC